MNKKKSQIGHLYLDRGSTKNYIALAIYLTTRINSSLRIDLGIYLYVGLHNYFSLQQLIRDAVP
jgi:hypothetical protein